MDIADGIPVGPAAGLAAELLDVLDVLAAELPCSSFGRARKYAHACGRPPGAREARACAALEPWLR